MDTKFLIKLYEMFINTAGAIAFVFFILVTWDVAKNLYVSFLKTLNRTEENNIESEN